MCGECEQGLAHYETEEEEEEVVSVDGYTTGWRR